jgi:hypothetical protein
MTWPFLWRVPLAGVRRAVIISFKALGACGVMAGAKRYQSCMRLQLKSDGYEDDCEDG